MLVSSLSFSSFFFNDTATTEIYTLSLHDALPIFAAKGLGAKEWNNSLKTKLSLLPKKLFRIRMSRNLVFSELDRKSGSAGMPRPISYAVFCLKKKKKKQKRQDNSSKRHSRSRKDI